MLAFKTLLHLACGLPLLWLFAAVDQGALGGDPVQYIIHFLGMGTLNTLGATLLLSPLARQFKLGALLQVRRLLGLWCFAYAALHVAAFVAFDLLFDWMLLATEVVKRPYIVVGFIALVVLTALALTSPKAVQRRMGRRWQSLHRWVYLVAILGPVHFWWSVKSGNLEPVIYLLAGIGLLLWRPWVRQRLTKGKPAAKAARKAL